MRVRTGLAAVVALLAVGAGVTGCTSGDDEGAKASASGLTYLGDDVVDAEATLSAADALWRTTWQQWDQVITVPDDSRCWFLADDAGEIAPHGLCGPLRGLGTPAPEWVLVSFQPQVPQTGSVRMTPGAILPYDPEAGYNSRRIVDAAGEEGDRDVDVPQPTGWPKVLPPGQTEAHPMRQFGRETLVRARVDLLGHDHLVWIVASKRIQFTDRSVYVPRRGGAFVDFRFRRWDSDRALEAAEALRKAAREGTLKLRIEYDDRPAIRGTLRIPEERGTGLKWKVYGPSGFFSVPTLTGARFVISDGKSEYTTTEDWRIVRSLGG